MAEFTLSGLNERLKDLETRFDNKPLDTHIFAAASGIAALSDIVPPAPRRKECVAPEIKLSLDSILGLTIWNDPAIPQDEIQIGRIEWKDGVPSKIVTKVIQLNA